MNLHLETKLFRQAIITTSQQMKIRAEYVEKDYWVCYALYEIFNSDVADYAVFKGGTALSKCYDIIKRFSEDIDLVVIRDKSESDNQLKRKIKNITNAVSAIMPEIEVEGITIKRGMNRKTGHQYPKLFNGKYGQVRSEIIVEATWLGYYEPYTTAHINSYIYDMMLFTGQEAMTQQYKLSPFEVRVLDSRRTICEKIMSLVRFSYSNEPIEDLKKKVRHTYDIHLLLQEVELQEFFISNEFETMLLKVAQDDVASFRNNNTWLKHHPNDCLFFSDLGSVWKQLSEVYESDFKGLVYGDFPSKEIILESLISLRERLKNVEWSIEV